MNEVLGAGHAVQEQIVSPVVANGKGGRKTNRLKAAGRQTCGPVNRLSLTKTLLFVDCFGELWHTSTISVCGNIYCFLCCSEGM